MYKEYETAFYKAFERVGVQPPADFKSMFFKSGVTEQDINQNLNTWLATNQSYKWQSGNEAPVQVAAGIQGNQADAGDLRIRMEKALAQHKEFTGNKFGGFDVNKDNSTVIKTI
jgi:hypothetical protein